jgi:N-acetyl-anhydromuramyl-L-alanine amidase AmpD
VIHCSASPETVNYSFKQLIKDHQLRGFETCGYHYYIQKDGTRHVGRPYNKIGAHVGDLGMNAYSIGICYEGGLDAKKKPKDTRTEAQKDMILKTILEVLGDVARAGYPTKTVRIAGHRDLSPDKNHNGIVEPNEWVKQCPCFDAEKEYKGLTSTFKLQ